MDEQNENKGTEMEEKNNENVVEKEETMIQTESTQQEQITQKEETNKMEEKVEPKAEDTTKTTKEPEKKSSSNKMMVIGIIAVIIVAIIIGIVMVVTSTSNEGDNNSNDRVNTNNISNKKEEEDENKLEIGQKTKVEEICEFTIVSNRLVKRIDPPSPASYYNYFQADDGNIYLDIVVDVKNLAEEEVKQTSMFLAKVYIDDKKYDSGLIGEKENGTNLDSYTSISKIGALETKRFHIATQIPEEAAVAGKTIKLVITADKQKYSYNMNIIDDPNQENQPTTSTINIGSKGKQIAVGEKVTAENVCEFTIVKSELKSKIEPPSPTGYYTYFKADDGKVYFDLVADIKNLKSEAVKQNTVIGNVTLIYDGNYEYKCALIVEKSNGTNLDSYTNTKEINPLEQLRYHIATQVPEEVQSSDKSIEVKITINGEDYVYRVR